MKWRVLAVLTVASLMVDPVGGQAVPEWFQWRGPNRDGHSAETGLLQSWPKAGPPLAWRANGLGDAYSSFSTSGGRLFTLGARAGIEYVIALDRATGKKVWEYQNGRRFQNDRGDGPRSTPTVDGDRLYVFGGSGDLVKYVLRTPAGPLTLINLHLETPRRGLASLRRGRGTARTEVNSQVREIGSERARAWLRDVEGPLVIAGDFNMPVESRVYARHWGDLENAFSTSGLGFGWTRLMVRYQVRIDHVLVTGGAHAVRAGLGPDLGSDHLPVVTAIRMP